MSAHLILGPEAGPKVWLFAILRVRELGLERRGTVRSLSTVGAGNLRGSAPSTKRTRVDEPLVYRLLDFRLSRAQLCSEG